MELGERGTKCIYCPQRGADVHARISVSRFLQTIHPPDRRQHPRGRPNSEPGQRRTGDRLRQPYTPAERNYSATELECLAVVWGVRHFRGYLEGYPFTVITDHQSLKWLQHLDSPTGRLARWLFELQQFDYEVRYRSGSAN